VLDLNSPTLGKWRRQAPEHKYTSYDAKYFDSVDKELREKWKYGKRIDGAGFLRKVDPDHVGILMRGPDFDCEGIVVRSVGNTEGPKALTYKNRPEYNGLSWFEGKATLGCPNLYAVEDSVSALVLYGLGLPSVSLNGTGLSTDRVDAMLGKKWKVVLMLDADATGKALMYRIRYGPDKIQVIRLVKDIKDMEDVEIITLLREAGALDAGTWYKGTLV